MNYYTDFAKIPTGVYGCIYIDPCWTYQDKALAGNRGAGCKYELMTLNELKQLPVPALAAEDCVCLMWVTYPMLAEGLELMAAYGFTYKTVAFTWVKLNKTIPVRLAEIVRAWLAGTADWTAFFRPLLFMGMGRWSRANAEICILGTKGKPKRANAGVHSVIMSPIQGHSRKPDEARDRIVSLLGDIPRIELFARGSSDGFDAWGNTPEYLTSSEQDTLSHIAHTIST